MRRTGIIGENGVAREEGAKNRRRMATGRESGTERTTTWQKDRQKE